MKPDFSEFSYGFALTREICTRLGGGLSAAPVFPSLIEEGKDGGGHDVMISRPGNPLFIQFKLSQHMVRRSAGQWGLFGSKYYRFWIHARRHSKQHELLLKRDVAPNAVYYAAPSIHRVDDLNKAFLHGHVIESSTFFRPRDIGAMPDEDAHCIAFKRGARVGYRCSTPREVPVVASGEAFLESLAVAVEGLRPVEPSERWVVETATAIESDFYGDENLVESRFLVGLSGWQRLGHLSRTILGCELLWVTRTG